MQEVNREWEHHWQNNLHPFFLRRKDSDGNPTFRRQVNHPIRRMIINRTVGISVLDVGSGSCMDYPLFKRRGIKYVAVDITRKFMEHARELYDDVNTIHGTVMNLPFKDGAFDTVYCKDLIEHLHPGEYTMGISEMWRVAKHKIMIAFFLPPVSGPPTVERVQTKTGFYFKNHYNREEVTAFIENLRGFEHLQVTEDIGYNNSSLYEAERKE